DGLGRDRELLSQLVSAGWRHARAPGSRGGDWQSPGPHASTNGYVAQTSRVPFPDGRPHAETICRPTRPGAGRQPLAALIDLPAGSAGPNDRQAACRANQTAGRMIPRRAEDQAGHARIRCRETRPRVTAVYFTDRGIEELEDRRGGEQVTVDWVAG